MPATMLTGVIRGGRVELDIPADLPDGTPVRVSVGTEADANADDDIGSPPPDEPYDRETELAILREAHADALADRGGVPHAVFMAELAAEFGVSLPKRVG